MELIVIKNDVAYVENGFNLGKGVKIPLKDDPEMKK